MYTYRDTLEESELNGTRCSRSFLLLFAQLFATGCAGPTSPFGALHSLTLLSKTPTTNGKMTDQSSPIQIRFLPKRQILHSKSDLIVEISDAKNIPQLQNVKVFFNSVDVTSTFIENVEVKNRIKEKILEIEFKDLRLKLLDENNIKIGYTLGETTFLSQFQKPVCNFYDKKPINNIQGFRPPQEYIFWMNDIAKKQHLNPSLLTGIIAQESSFNPKAISWVKAIGLTQMTQLAEEQIRVHEKNWPQTRQISSLNYIQLKQKVSTGEINQDTEWRLDPQKSIVGGAEYVQYLHNYWQQTENQDLLSQIPGDRQIILSQAILASYNSGPARVKNAIREDAKNWLQLPDMKEAFKYVQKVFSYCYHFSERSVSDDG